jgi:hypothetical protein
MEVKKHTPVVTHRPRLWMYVAAGEFLLIAVLALVLLRTSNSVSDLQVQVLDLTKSYETTRDALSTERLAAAERNDLQQANNTNLSRELSAVSKNYAALDERFTKLRTQYSQLADDIDEYEERVDENLDWFKVNAHFGEQLSAVSKRTDECFDVSGDICTIRTGCTWLVNQERLGLTYRTDMDTTKKIERIQSLDEFVENRGGDCEDYSLFFKAQMNHLREQCIANDASDIQFEGWQYVDNPTHSYKVDFENQWTIKSAESVPIPREFQYPNIVCGDVYNEFEELQTGHCVIAFTDKPIESALDLVTLQTAAIIEPQDGSFLGYLGTNYLTIARPGRDRIPQDTDGWQMQFYMVITDNDLFQFSYQTQQWRSYSGFGERAERIRALADDSE